MYWLGEKVMSEEQKVLKRDLGMNGWIVDYGIIKDVTKQASNMFEIGNEEVEAVLLAMVDLGYVKLEIS
jgi:hypothetical protein